MNLNHQLEIQLKVLRLGGVMETLEPRLQEAQSESLGYLDFLQLLVQDEIERREAKKLSLRLTRASFEEQKTLEEFDFTFNPKINRQLIRDLATCTFVEKREHVLLYGPRARAKAISLRLSAIRPAEEVMMPSSPRPQNCSVTFWPAGLITPGRSGSRNTFTRICSSSMTLP